MKNDSTKEVIIKQIKINEKSIKQRTDAYGNPIKNKGKTHKISFRDMITSDGLADVSNISKDNKNLISTERNVINLNTLFFYVSTSNKKKHNNKNKEINCCCSIF